MTFLGLIYNLTPQEKENIRNGEPVNTKGKTTITELAKGSFSNGGQLAKMTYNWTEETIWQGCSHVVEYSYYNASSFPDWGKWIIDDVKPNNKNRTKPAGFYSILWANINFD
ncbi:hypothetical protein LNP04_13020 [Chryseobacterium sp. C-71]|uniref:hypothetical protein n=1 Tax=Chryseobacterium sp. C-71 TaxID=2893882 RepID=UPI001E476268|nr:hypothetical protein [Chryseobacterium sp. C-71]UFH30897.1 hypothetical protein LNP04_13020 [Chryseobacterium sp. C-71]